MKLLDRLMHHDDLQAQFWRTDFPILKNQSQRQAAGLSR